MKYFLSIALAAAMLLCFSFCTKYETLTLIQKEKKGSIYGFAGVIGLQGNTLPDRAGVKVSLEGIMPEIFALTDTGGKYTLDSVSAGSYTLIFEKDGVGPERRPISYYTTGGNRPTYFPDGINSMYYPIGGERPTLLYQRPVLMSTLPVIRYPQRLDSTRSYDTLFALAGTYTSADRGSQYVQLVFDTFPGISETQNRGRLNAISVTGGTYKIMVPMSMRRKFWKGKTHYGRIYGSWNPNFHERYDPILGRNVPLPLSLNPSPEFTFTPRW